MCFVFASDDFLPQITYRNITDKSDRPFVLDADPPSYVCMSACPFPFYLISPALSTSASTTAICVCWTSMAHKLPPDRERAINHLAGVESSGGSLYTLYIANELANPLVHMVPYRAGIDLTQRGQRT